MQATDTGSDLTESLRRKYQLRPNNYKAVFNQYGKEYGYDELYQVSKKEFGPLPDAATKLQDHIGIFKNHLNASALDQYKNYFQSSSPTHWKIAEFLPLIEQILTPDVDAAIKEYMQSEYSILWCNWYVAKHPDHDGAYLNKWHCDAGPTKHLKTITYFDSSSEHGSGTALASLKATDALKELGYVLNDIRTRQIDIDDLTDHFGIDLGKEILRFDAGDTLVFNPTMRMHRVELPRGEEKRHAFSIGFVPSPVSWREVYDRGVEPRMDYVPFETFAFDVMKATSDIVEKRKASSQDAMTKANVTPIPFEKVIDFPETIFLNDQALITTEYSLKQHLIHIFKDQQYANKISSIIIASNGGALNFTLKELLVKLKASFQRELKWEGFFVQQDLQHVQNLLEFESRYLSTVNAYNPATKPNPEAVMWPNPAHPKYPRSKYDMSPYVKGQKICDKTTPIASAGSCFAFEIAKKLQKDGFNYLVEEKRENITRGVFVDHYLEGEEFAPASANYGILFNTPSLKQLAEKAFGLRTFPRYCAQLGGKFYSDPFRENVYFESLEAFEADYPKHIEALRRVLTKSEVFIFTAGLNECWELPDGNVISRNPKPSIQHLLRHRTLTVQDNIDNINGFIEIVRRYNPKLKVVLTLSPVPFLATGRADTHHVIEANTHSKAVLRVALDEVVKNTPDVYYLPSYEMVTECVEHPWTEDHRHVKPEVVARVIDMFKEMYVKA